LSKEELLTKYMEEVRERLYSNATDYYKNNFITYTYSNEQVDENVNYFEECMNKSLSSYKALLFFGDYLETKNNVKEIYLWAEENNIPHYWINTLMGHIDENYTLNKKL